MPGPVGAHDDDDGSVAGYRPGRLVDPLDRRHPERLRHPLRRALVAAPVHHDGLLVLLARRGDRALVESVLPEGPAARGREPRRRGPVEDGDGDLRWDDRAWPVM